MRHHPPRLGKRILRWFVNAEFVEEVEGDLDELFYERLNEESVLKAKTHYLLDVVGAIRPYHPKRKSSPVGHEIMNWIFFRLAYRNLAKRKAFSAINILGLSTGLVSFLLIMQYVAFEKSYDRFHRNVERIYRVAFNWGEIDYQGENSSVYASSVPAMGPAIAAEISEVESFTRFVPVLTVKPYCVLSHIKNGRLEYTGNGDKGFYADSVFLRIFTFPIASGQGSPLDEPNSIVITRSFAKKIFKDETYDKIIGSAIEIDTGQKEDHIVTAILEDIPSNSHIQFDYLLSYATINSGRLEGNLGWSQFYTYVLMNHAQSDLFVESRLQNLITKLYGDDSHISIFLQPLKEIYLNSHLREELGEGGSSLQLTFLTIVAYVILFMAWINYVNMSLAVSMERINEIGVKKVLGSTRSHLVMQFFTESVLITGTSFLLAILMLVLLQQPFGRWLGTEFQFFHREHINFILAVLSAVFIGTIIAGLYPSLVLASFKPVRVLGKKFETSTEGIFFKKSLVYFQFIVSFVILSSTLIIGRQINFMKNADLGVELSGCISLRSPGGRDSTYTQRLQLFKDRLLTNSSISDVCLTSSIPGRRITSSTGVQRVIGPELEGNNIFYLHVDEDFLPTYGIGLIAGSNFTKSSGDIPSVIINEAALTTLKFDSPRDALSHRIHWQRKEYEVIGVFANYNHLFLKETFEPVMLTYEPAATGFITIKVNDGRNTEALAVAARELQALFPASPFEYAFLQSTYDRQYDSIRRFEMLIKYFALLAILIACLGLFALSYYSGQRRLREMSVRKVFGAEVIDVLILLSRSYITIVLISCILGSFLTWHIMSKWLENFAFAIKLDPADFTMPMGLITSIVIATLSFNCVKTSFINPTTILKQS